MLLPGFEPGSEAYIPPLTLQALKNPKGGSKGLDDYPDYTTGAIYEQSE